MVYNSPVELLRRAAESVVIALVVAVYVFFATTGTMRFPAAPAEPRGWDNPGGGYYAQLAEGFLRGDTYFPLEPHPRFAAVGDPYDYLARERMQITYLWDASYYRGRYYLYFTPLPVALFYVPYRLISGTDADDSMAAVFFSVWTFAAAVSFVRRAVPPSGWRLVWIVFAGLANLLPFALSNVRVYEVAILCATAFSATWAAALLRFDEKPSAANAAWMALWLSLAISARPNLVVLVLPTAFVLFRRGWRMLLAAAIPVVAAALAYFSYNFARFGDPLETGISYQLTYVSMKGLSRCGLCSGLEMLRFADNTRQYLFAPPRMTAEFPHVGPATAYIDKRVSWPGGEPEEILGIVPLVPLTLAGTVLGCWLLLARRGGTPRARVGIGILGGAWLVLFALSTCWWIVSRYAFDFQVLMLLGTVACVEEASRSRAARVLIAAAVLHSIVLSLLLGLEGREGAFRDRVEGVTARTLFRT